MELETNLQIYKKVYFTRDDTINRSNPDRGFYDATYHFEKSYDYDPYDTAKKNGFNLIYALIDLHDYIDNPTLSDELLENIKNNFEAMQKSGIKAILRIRYRENNSTDPSKSTILSHLNQLKEILQSYANSVSSVQMGLIGEYGEWHDFTGEFSKDNDNYKENRKELISKMMEIFPKKYIQLRTPMHKELLYGTSQYYADISDSAEIKKENAFDDSITSKIGQYDDCFLSDETDMGTFADNNITFWENYVSNDTNYTVNGGEMCQNNDKYTNCQTAIERMKKFHFSYLNADNFPDILQKWKDEGCYEYIDDNLGYNLVLDSADIAFAKNTLYIDLFITNYGFAAPYSKKNFIFLLKNSSNSYEFTQNDIDIRKFFSNTTLHISKTIDTSLVAKGVYSLYLKLEDSNSYIKLSDKGIWDDTLKANLIKSDIDIE